MSKKEMLLKRIQETYSSNTPFSLKILKSQLGHSFSYKYLKVYISRLVAGRDLVRISNGIYFYPKKDSIIPAELQSVDPFEIIKMEYMDNFDGFETGLCLANKLGLTSQVPATYEIVSKNIKEKKKIKFIQSIKVLIRKAPDNLNEQNYYAAQINSLLKNVKLYSEKSEDETLSIIEKYAIQHGLTLKDFLMILI